MEEKLRSEVELKYKWNLKAFYSNEEDFNKDYEFCMTKLEEIKKFENHVMDNAKTLYDLEELYWDIKLLFERVYSYGQLNVDIELSNSDYQKLNSKTQKFENDFTSATLFIDSEILKFSSRLKKFYIDEPKLKKYQRYFDEIIRFKDHIPNKKVLKTISDLELYKNKLETTYQLIKNSEQEYKKVTIKGQKVTANLASLKKYSIDKDRTIRKKVIDAYHKSFIKHNKSLSANYDLFVTINSQIATLESYDSVLEKKLFSTGVSRELFNNIINKVLEKKYLKERNFNVIKRKLKVKKLYYYDNLDFIYAADKEYDFEKASDWVLKALEIFGDDYTSKVKEMLNGNYIDVCPTKDKKSGGYNWSCYIHPYILLNYYQKFDDVFTLAHEMGHAVNSLIAKENVPFYNYSYSNIQAEVASLTNELILANYIYENSDDKKERVLALSRIIDLFLLNVFEATMRAEFEKSVYDAFSNKESLTADKLNELFCNACFNHNAKNIIASDNIKYMWTKIAHNYYTFYNFQYAVGLLSAVKIVFDITKDKNKLNNYMKFLSSGGSKNIIDTFKIVGIDLESSKFIEEALGYFEEIIGKYEKLVLEEE